MIEVRNLTKSYRIEDKVIKAVDNVSLKVGEGEFVSIMGHSGCGKTTLLSLIGGLAKPDSGTIIIDNTDLCSISDNELSEFRNQKINFIYQFSSLIPTLNVIENVILPTAFGKKKQNGIYEYAFKLLDMVGLGDKLKAYPSQLSGGQQRRVSIARAFMNAPEVILADEPTGDLDEETEAEMINLFKRINKEKGITFIIVTHSSELAKEAKRRIRMSSGSLQEWQESLMSH
jgi:putative ABC transport system ATP-binding protein/lipoprotein-releasing system ATP-binding protein